MALTLGLAMLARAESASCALDYQDVLVCGRNSLAMFLMLTGRDDVPESTVNSIYIDGEGSSLLDLRNAAREIGVATEVRQYRLEEANRMPMPSIMQLYTSPTTVTGLHFGVLYKQDRERLYIIDGTTAERHTIRRDKLPQFWTGYALVPTRSAFRALAPAAVATISMLCFAVYIRWRKGRRV